VTSTLKPPSSRDDSYTSLTVDPSAASPAMIFSFSSLKAHKARSFALLARSRSLTAIIAFSLCSMFFLTWLLPGFSVKTKLGRFLPTDSVATEAQIHWNNSSRRLIVFGDSWSDNGQYPIDPPPKDQMPSREDARGKVWTEWLCSSASYCHMRKVAKTDFLRYIALITTTSQGRCPNRGTVVTAALLLTATC